MSVFEWADPPQRHHGPRGPRVWDERLKPLLERPGQWAIVYRAATRNAAGVAMTAIRTGRVRVTLPGRFEFTTREGDDGSGVLYARWMGEGE